MIGIILSILHHSTLCGLKCWRRGLDEPPDVISFDDIIVTPKRPRKESLSSSLTNA